jgi:hypothetical protein
VADETENAFLIEKYVPRLDEATALAISSRFRAAILRPTRRDGTLRWIQSFALLSEETYCCIIGAPDLEHIAQLKERVGLEYDHVVELVALDPAPPRRA